MIAIHRLHRSVGAAESALAASRCLEVAHTHATCRTASSVSTLHRPEVRSISSWRSPRAAPRRSCTAASWRCATSLRALALALTTPTTHYSVRKLKLSSDLASSLDNLAVQIWQYRYISNCHASRRALQMYKSTGHGYGTRVVAIADAERERIDSTQLLPKGCEKFPFHFRNKNRAMFVKNTE